MNITRGEFLKMVGLGTAGLVATSALPAFAEEKEKQDLFPGRGRWERLSIVSQHVDAGATKPFSILHISDTHLTEAYPGESEWTRRRAKQRSKVFGGHQEESLRDSLVWAKQHVDYVIHTGDLIDFQSEANFDLVRKYYGKYTGTITGSLGNHEFFCGQAKAQETDAFKKEMAAKLAEVYPFDISLQSTVVNGVNFVTLDNVYGTVTAEQATRFEDEAKKCLPIVLCMHCPIDTPNIRRAASKYWKREDLKTFPDVTNFKLRCSDSVTKDFIAYLKSLPLLKAILAGHYHITVADRFSPTAMEYLVGGNFIFHGQEITFS